MSDVIVLTIKPRWAKEIYGGWKKFEFRKVIPKRKFGKIFLYESSPVKRITGMIIKRNVFKGTPNTVWTNIDIIDKHFPVLGSMTREEFMEYFKNRKIAYAIYIGRVIKYEKQFDPVKAGWWKISPQNFMYIPYEMRRKMKLEGFPLDFTLRSID